MKTFKELFEGKFLATHLASGKPNPSHPAYAKHKAEYDANKLPTVKRLLNKPASKKKDPPDLDKIFYDLTGIIGQFYPDGDPADYFPKYYKQQGINYEIARKAFKKHGYKDEYEYISQMGNDMGYNESVAKPQKLATFRTKDANNNEKAIHVYPHVTYVAGKHANFSPSSAFYVRDGTGESGAEKHMDKLTSLVKQGKHKEALQHLNTHGYTKWEHVKESVDINEKKLTPAELKKREEIAKAMERENPGMEMGKKMAIATAQAKKVAESQELEEASNGLHMDIAKATDRHIAKYKALGDDKQFADRLHGAAVNLAKKHGMDPSEMHKHINNYASQQVSSVKESLSFNEYRLAIEEEDKQKPYVSSDRSGNYEVLGNRGQSKATFSQKEHGYSARKKAQEHLKKNYDAYMNEEVEELEEVNHREYAAAGKMHPSFAKHYKAGTKHAMDFYSSKEGDKLSGHVVKSNDDEVHMRDTKGKVHKFQISVMEEVEIDENSPFDWKKKPSEIDWTSKDKDNVKQTDGGMVHKARETARNAERGGAAEKKAVGRPQGEYGSYKIDKATRDDPEYKKALSAKVRAAKAEGLAARSDYKKSMDAAIKKRQLEIAGLSEEQRQKFDLLLSQGLSIDESLVSAKNN